MELRNLRYFEAIARLGSITRAAEELHIAQPALSVAMKKLEEELGVMLFNRQQNRRVTLTAEGEILLKRAARLFQEVDSARREIEDATELRSGEVKIGVPPMYGLQFFLPVMDAFHKAHPGIDVKVTCASAGDTGKMLDAGEIDLAVLESRRVREGWGHALVGEEEVVLAVRRDHPIAKKTAVSGKDLDNLDMAVFDETFLQRNVLDRRCQKSGARYRMVVESNYVPIIFEAANAGLGAATVIKSLVHAYDNLVAIPFEPAEVFQFHLCWLDARYLSRANQAFVDSALEQYRARTRPATRKPSKSAA